MYVCNAENIPPFEQSQLLSKDSLQELLPFQTAGLGQTRQSFMLQALQWIENGAHVYTYVEHGRLLYVSWMMEVQEKFLFPEVNQEFYFPPASTLLLDGYIHGRLVLLPGCRLRAAYKKGYRFQRGL